MEEQHEVFLEKTEPAEPGPSQTAVVWSVMVFLWCEVWSSGGSARACCDDFHLPSRNMFPEIGHCSSISVQSWLTMACVCGGGGVGGGWGEVGWITGLELHLYCPDFLLSFFPPWTPIPWQQDNRPWLSTCCLLFLLCHMFLLVLILPLFFPHLCPSHHSADPLQATSPCESFHCPWDAILPASILLCKCLSPSDSDIYRPYKTCLLQHSASRQQSICPRQSAPECWHREQRLSLGWWESCF